MRVKSRWNKTDKPHTPDEIASALAFILWRIATNGLLELENEGFQTDTQLQRLTAIAEFMAFLVHVSDRLAATQMGDSERAQFVNGLGRYVADTVSDNIADVLGEGDYRASFIDTLNERMGEYADYGFSASDGPDFGFLRQFGQRVTATMGPRDSRWILEQIMEVEAPESVQTLRKAMWNLFSWT
ncbi:MAG: hypothetical protein B7Z66_10815 [Chromatiales bacterium 21-64-14]|nr:MAG: hypothetical protein B7Z66_10815 [Chromatiales bacterium 21-64-14]HQU15621.1 hypothetical protein [Gammaproteobacteria bacterium]